MPLLLDYKIGLHVERAVALELEAVGKRAFPTLQGPHPTTAFLEGNSRTQCFQNAHSHCPTIPLLDTQHTGSQLSIVSTASLK